MKKNRLRERQAKVPEDIKNQIDLSFAIAEQIDIILLKKGWTQKDLAKSLGKSESEISKWMSGLHNFTFATIGKLMVALGEPLIICPKDVSKEYILITFNESITNFSIPFLKQKLSTKVGNSEFILTSDSQDVTEVVIDTDCLIGLN